MGAVSIPTLSILERVSDLANVTQLVRGRTELDPLSCLTPKVYGHFCQKGQNPQQLFLVYGGAFCGGDAPGSWLHLKEQSL